MTQQTLALWVNDEAHHLLSSDNRTLLEVLREDLALTGTKHGCDLGECGACTVLIDGQPALACMVLACEVAGRSVTTIEGLAQDATPDPLQVSFAQLGAAQCGYCTPGMILSARALLNTVIEPSTQEITEALAGNLCRCTGYNKIVEAIHAVSLGNEG